MFQHKFTVQIYIFIQVIHYRFRVIERGRTKCAQYWGPEPGSDVHTNGFTISTVEVNKNPDYTISMLLLINNKVYT